LERKTPFHQENKKTLIIPSTGNFGISLATLAAPKYRVICILPERITNDRIALLKALGVEILRSPNEAKPEAPESAYSVATKLAEQLTDAVVMDEVKYINNIRGEDMFYLFLEIYRPNYMIHPPIMFWQTKFSNRQIQSWITYLLV
jgi:cysteine synthase